MCPVMLWPVAILGETGDKAPCIDTRHLPSSIGHTVTLEMATGVGHFRSNVMRLTPLVKWSGLRLRWKWSEEGP